jgi:hypothetical protein
MDRIGCIFVSESVANSLELSNIHPLFLQEMEVKEKPVDGLRYPSDPPWVEGRDATIHWDPKKPEG